MPTGADDRARYELHSDWVSAVAYSPDGRLLFTCSRDKTIKVILTENGHLLRTLTMATDYVNTVTATPTLALSGGATGRWQHMT